MASIESYKSFMIHPLVIYITKHAFITFDIHNMTSYKQICLDIIPNMGQRAAVEYAVRQIIIKMKVAGVRDIRIAIHLTISS